MADETAITDELTQASAGAQLLLRIAQTLKEEIGPAVLGEYEKTQAFMAAVVLEKLGRQRALAPVHAEAAATEAATLIAELRSAFDAAPVPRPLRDAFEALASARDDASYNRELCSLIETLYARASELGEARFAALLQLVRTRLRANVDRQMAWSA